MPDSSEHSSIGVVNPNVAGLAARGVKVSHAHLFIVFNVYYAVSIAMTTQASGQQVPEHTSGGNADQDRR